MALNDNEKSLINNIITLERRCPWTTPPGARIDTLELASGSDLLRVNAITKELAAYAGLDKYCLVVCEAKQPVGKCAGIQTDLNSKESFIELDSDIMWSPKAVVATLCHEISHAWLDDKSIALTKTSENEILTDITAIYLGFGKLLLNGNWVKMKTETIERSLSLGYLNKQDLCFVYVAISVMRGISVADICEGLNQNVRKLVRNIAVDFCNMDDASTTDKLLSELRQIISYTENSYAKSLRSSSAQIEGEILGVRREMHLKNKRLDFLNYLNYSLEAKTIEELRDTVSSAIVVSKFINQNARVDGAPIEQDLSHFNSFICPYDKTALRVPEGAGEVLLRCPKCNGRFTHDSKLLDVSSGNRARANSQSQGCAVFLLIFPFLSFLVGL